MAYQRSLSRLQASPHWRTLEKFAVDELQLEQSFGTKVTSAAREDIRQICRHFNMNFRCVGDGSQKRIVALKFDAIRERDRAKELAQAAPTPVAGFYKAVIKLLPESCVKVNALFVYHYGGEKAWTLGEEGAPKKAARQPSPPPAKRQRLREGEPADADEDGAASSSSEDAEALLGRWKTVSKDGSTG